MSSYSHRIRRAAASGLRPSSLLLALALSGASAGAAEASAGQFIAGQHTELALSRDYKLYVPPGPSEPARPLVLMLHGCTQGPDEFAATTGMNELAQAQGLLLIYPAQTKEANPALCWNWFLPAHQQRGQGEAALLAGLTRELVQRHKADPRRVYVAGMSAGAAMAAVLGDAYPDLFAAVGLHSGVPAGAASDVQQAYGAMKNGAAPAGQVRPAPPTIVFHGDQDPIVHPLNGERAAEASAGAASATALRLRTAQGREYTRRVFGTQAEHWLLHGAGHVWSGGRAGVPYTDPSGPDASAEMLRFFLARSLPAR